MIDRYAAISSAISLRVGSRPITCLKVPRATSGSVQPASVYWPMSAGMPTTLLNAHFHDRAPAPPVEISVPSMSNSTATGGGWASVLGTGPDVGRGGDRQAGPALRLDDVHQRVDQRQVRERVREVAQVAARVRIEVLGVQAERSGVGQEALAQLAGCVLLADLVERGDQPERTDRERLALDGELW